MNPLLLSLLLGMTPAADAESIEPDRAGGSSRAVVVGDVPLVHTAQGWPVDRSGKLIEGDIAAQTAKALDNLGAVLAAGRSGLDRVIKLHICAASDDDVPAIRKVLAERFTGKLRPAVTFVVGELARPGRVAVDAVALTDLGPKPGAVTMLHAKELPRDTGAHLAVLPAGPAIHISGQAERGATLAEATRKTMASLGATLRFLERGPEHVVQVKAFVHPVSKREEVQREIAAFFGKSPVPPVVLVEWTFKDSIEIELVVAGAPASRERERPEATSPVDYLTPPGMTASPIYCRVCRINHGKRVYIGGLSGAGDMGAEQVKDTFAQLGALLKKSGSDFRHLAKATYYVSTEDASKQLNVLRPNYYDPKRPPAASKAPVRGVGQKGRGITIDMIAVVP